MAQASATYTFMGRSIRVFMDATNGDFAAFRLDQARYESKDSLYNRAYNEANRWANEHRARLETFRAE